MAIREVWECYLIICLSLLSCTQIPVNQNDVSPVFTPQHAELFKIIKFKGDSILVLIHPSNQQDNDSIILNKQVLNIATLSATHSAFISELGADSLIGAVDNCSFHAHPNIKNRCSNETILSFGETSALHPEMLLAAKVNLITISGFDNKPSWSNSVLPFGIKTARIWEWKEQSPLAKAEWIIAFGYLCGEAQKAKDIYKKELDAYQRLVATTASINPNSFAGNSYQGVWYCPAKDSYMAKLLKDAGFNYLVDYPGRGSASIKNEEAIFTLQKADVWIYHGSCRDLDCILSADERIEHAELALNNIWAPWLKVNPDLSNPFWDYGAVYPSLILADYIAIANRDSTAEMNFYAKLK